MGGAYAGSRGNVLKGFCNGLGRDRRSKEIGMVHENGRAKSNIIPLLGDPVVIIVIGVIESSIIVVVAIIIIITVVIVIVIATIFEIIDIC